MADRGLTRFVATLVLVSVALGAEVHELSPRAPSGEETAFDEGATVNNPTSLFPGPVYGLPGYKESHDWVGDYDPLSPLVFDVKWYAIRYGLSDKSEPQVQQDWLDHLKSDTDLFPEGCRQGNELFSPQKYFRANPNIKESLRTNSDGQEICGSIVKYFIKTGAFEAQSRFNPKAEAAAAKEEPEQVAAELISLPVKKLKGGSKQDGWVIGKDRTTLGEDAMEATEAYTLTFWYQPWGAREPECNILHHGNSFQEKVPMISQVAGGSNTLKFVVGQTNNNEYSCTANQVLKDKQWTFIALKVSKHKIEVSYDGTTVCQKENSGGAVQVLPGRELYVSSPWQPPASGVIQKVRYFPFSEVPDELLSYQMAHSKERLEDVK